MKAYAMDVHKGRTSRTRFRRGTARQKESLNSFIQMYVAQCHHPPIMGMYTMYHPLMIILVKDLDIFEVFNKIKEFKALIREPFCKED
jgi:transcription antitermination factor NusA-like protein